MSNTNNTTLQKLKFAVLNAVLSTLLFVLCYKLWLITLPKEFKTFLIIFIVMGLISWIGALVARLLSHHWSNREKNAKFYYRNFFVTLIYSLLVFSGFISQQFVLYPIFPSFDSPSEFIYTENVVFRLFVIKLFVMFFADFLADYYLQRRRTD